MSRDRPKKPNALIFEELEPRLLLSADIAGVAIDPMPDDSGDPVDEDDLLSLGQSLLNEPIPVDSQEADTGRNELVIIDPLTPDYQSLVDDLIDREGSDINFEIILLDSADNGIEQMGHILDQYRDLDALHLISHGGEGEVRLAGTTLDLSALNDSLEQIGGWSNAFAAEGDLLIYGCNLASTADGELFIDKLAQLTGVDVAASDDLTGSVSQGGDWDLEYQVGTLETSIAFSGQLQSSWSGTLDITTGLVGYYDFEEGSGAAAIDSSATGNNGTLIGSPVYTTGQVGSYALSFNGDFDRVEAPDSLATNFGNGDFAVGFWFNSTYSGGTARLVGDMDGGDGYVFYTTGVGDVTFGVISGIDSVTLASGGLFDGNWHHVVGMVNGADWSLYVDGTLVDSINNGFVGNIDNSNTLRIGASSASHNEYDGLIDDVRIYDRALTTTDINELIALAEDPPSITGASLTLSEGQTVTLDGANFSISDPDSSSFTYSLSGVAGGYFQLSTNPGVSITSFTSANLTGGVVQFVDNDDEIAPAFSVTVNDGTSDSNTRVATISYTPVNDAPDVINLDGDVLNYTEGDGVVLIEQGGDVVISDPDSSNFAGGSLTVEVDSGLQAAEDKFSIVNQGAGAGQIGLNVSDVTYSGVVIGSVSGGTGIDPLTVTLNSNATSAAVTALIRNISYENSNIDNPTGGSRSVVVDVTDGDGGASVTQNLTLNVTSVNDAPVVDLNGSDGAGADFAVTFTEDGGAVNVVDADATISDADSAFYENLSINLTNFPDGGNEQIVIAGYTFNYGTADTATRTVGSASFVIDFDGSGFNVTPDGFGWMPEVDLQNLLRGVTYENTSQDPTAGDRTINVFAQDSSLLVGPIATSTITVNPQNDSPTATNNTNSVLENGFVSGNVITDDSGSGIDSDPEGDGLQVTQVEGGAYTPGFPVTLASGAQVTFQSNGSYTYNTNGQFDGLGAGSSVDDSFTYQISDGNGGFDTATVTVTINGSNDAPSITSAGLTLDEGQTVTLSDANFAITDADDTAFTYTVSGISGGYFQLSSAPGTPITTFTSANLTGGLVQFVDNGDETAPVFSVTVNDGDSDSNTLAATINYTPVNDPLMLVTNSPLSVPEEGTRTITNSYLAVSDVDNSAAQLTYTLTSLPSSGSLRLSGSTLSLSDTFTQDDIDNNRLTFGFSDDASATSFAFIASDGTDIIGPIIFSVNGQPVNDAPVNLVPASCSVNENITLNFTGADQIQISDIDHNGGTMQVQLNIGAGGLLTLGDTSGLTFSAGDGTDDANMVFTGTLADINTALLTLSFTPTSDFNGDVNFTIITNDQGNSGTDPGLTGDAASEQDSDTFTITVNAINDAPVLDSALLTLSEGQTVTLSAVNFGITDPDDTAFTYTLSGVTGGYFQLSTNPGVSVTSFSSAELSGSLVQFVDNGDETAPAFSITVNDGDADSNTLAATVIYTSANDVPVLNSADMTVTEGQTVTLTAANFGITDPDDTDFSYTLSGVVGGYFQLSTNPGVSITSFTSTQLTANEVQFVDNGDEVAPVFSITVNDGTNDSNTLAAIVNFTTIDEAPIANNDSVNVDEGGSVFINVVSNDADPENALDLTSIVVVGLPTNGALVNNGDGTFVYTHNGSETLSDIFTYTVNDDSGATSNVAVVDLTIHPVNDVPVITSHAGSQAVTTYIDENLNTVAGVSADDAEGDGLTFSISGGADFGLFTIDHLTGLLSFSSAPNAESPIDSGRNNSYSVEVMVSDGNGGTAIQAFDIAVRDVDEFDVGLLMDLQSDPDQVTTIHAAGSEVGVTVWASDPDISNSDIVYSLVDDGGGHFVIDNTTGEISLSQPFVATERYQTEVIVRATSSDGSISQRSFLIEVLPVDEPVVEPAPPTLDEVIVDLLSDDDSAQIASDTPGWSSVSDLTDLSGSGESDEESAADDITEESAVVIPIETYEQTMSFTDRLSRSLVGIFDHSKNHSVAFHYFDLTSEPLDIDALPKLNTISADNSLVVPKTVWALLDAMSLEISQHQAEVDENSEMVFKGVTVGTVGLTAGYVAWLLRAGLLSASLLSFSPLWRQVDPLPVLSASAKKRTDNESEAPVEDAQEKRISKLFDAKRKSHQDRYAG
ncbi:MAG: DUF4347 domain-containing protein [Candidatus Thiodiazotropha sp. (ex Myrtea spinifera)]|nr:DUF4347 domain-containing protein [Candidatus Thiodiazotropha sp. (ex Myrtea spinifera)]